MIMVPPLLLALASSGWLAPADRGPGFVARTGATVQATATVRIVSAARIRLHGPPDRALPPRKVTVVHVGGVAQPVTLIEFE